jgi:hypothetical protein
MTNQSIRRRDASAPRQHNGFVKTERVQIERGNEGVEEARGVFGGDVIFQPFGEEQRLGPVQSGAMIHA